MGAIRVKMGEIDHGAPARARGTLHDDVGSIAAQGFGTPPRRGTAESAERRPGFCGIGATTRMTTIRPGASLWTGVEVVRPRLVVEPSL